MLTLNIMKFGLMPEKETIDGVYYEKVERKI